MELYARGEFDKAVWDKTVLKNGYDLIDDLSGMTVIDVGAHIGSFSYACLQRGASFVYAIEPDGEAVELTRKNLSSYPEDRIQIDKSAVWNKSFFGPTSFGRHEDGNTGSGSLAYATALGNPETSIDNIECIDIEDVIAVVGEMFCKIDMLKLDCEGAEYPILYSCCILEDIPNIVCEYHEINTPVQDGLATPRDMMNGAALAEFLRSKGYTVIAMEMVDTGIIWASRNPEESPFVCMREQAAEKSKTISVNLIAGSGANPDGWIFSRMTKEIAGGILDRHPDISLTVSAGPDESRSYDVYHYLHSTLAVKHKYALHRSVVTVHALDDLSIHRSYHSKKETLEKVPIVTSICNMSILEMADHGLPISKLRYTPQGIPENFFRPRPHEERSDVLVDEFGADPSFLEHNATDQHIRLGIIGKRYEDGRKGERFLVKAISKLATEIQNQGKLITLVFVGPGWSNDKMVNELMMGPVALEFYEDLDYEMYPEIYATLDAVIVSSKIEGGPLCILEAFACGLPVVSTPGGNANEFLTRSFEGKRLGRIVGYGDVPGFVSAIKDVVIDDIENIRTMNRREAISSVIWQSTNTSWKSEGMTPEGNNDPYAPYTWGHWTDRFADIYRELGSKMGNRIMVSDVFGQQEQEAFREMYRTGASKSLADIYVRNFMQVMPYAQSGVGLASFANVAKGVPTVIVGVGPSLDDNMDLLREFQDNVMIVTCDAGTKKLIREGVMPDIVFTADPSDRQIENFSDIPGPEFITMMPTVVHPMVFHQSRKSDCKIAWYNIADTNHEICQHIPRAVGAKGAIIPAVLTTGMAFIASLYMGSCPITFIGMDLCWYDVNKGYADGMSDKKVAWQQQNKMVGSAVMMFPDMYGKLVVTDPCFVSFWQWISDYLADQNLVVHNSSGKGILHGDRVIQTPFDTWLSSTTAKETAQDTKQKLMNVYDTARRFVDTMICHQFSQEDMGKMI